MIRSALTAFAVATLSGCASLGMPGADELARLPVVRYGDAAPADAPYILLYPAGAPLPVNAWVGGSLLQEEASATLTVRTKKDLYTYKHWASLDGKNWCSANSLVSGNFLITVPGEKDGRNPGTMRAEFNLK